MFPIIGALRFFDFIIFMASSTTFALPFVKSSLCSFFQSFTESNAYPVT